MEKQNSRKKSFFIILLGIFIIFIFQLGGSRQGLKEDNDKARICSKQTKGAFLNEFALVDRAVESLSIALSNHWIQGTINKYMPGMLDRYAHIISNSVVYYMDNSGAVLSSSNSVDIDKFVGRNYSFRPYFQEARLGRHGRYMAVGTANTHRAGYYSSLPIRNQKNEVVGVIVIKRNLDITTIIQEINSNKVVFLTDENAFVYASTNSDSTYKNLWPAIFPGPLLEGDEVNFKGESYQIKIIPLGVANARIVFLYKFTHMSYYRKVGFFLGCLFVLFIVLSAFYFKKIDY